VIAAATGGLKKLVKPEINGLLFDGSLEDLYQKYKQLNTVDGLAARLREKAILEVNSTYSWTAITKLLQQYYDEIIAKHRKQK
jgi:glycosyltransferase involved in cell wall biosynthesis